MMGELVQDAEMRKLQDWAKAHAEEVKRRFPGAGDLNAEIEATKEFRLAARGLKAVFGSTRVNHYNLLDDPEGRRGALLEWCVPEWDLVRYAAKLLRYITLSAKYEVRIFTADERLRRDEREQRHRELMNKWEPLWGP